MVAAVASATETPLEMAGCVALGVLSIACSRTFKVETDPGYSEELVLWICAAASSGNRKTAVMNFMTAPLVAWEREQTAIIEPLIKLAESERKTQDARLAALRAKAAKAEAAEYAQLKCDIDELERSMPPIPSRPRLVTQDATPERVASMLAEQGERLGIVSDEGGFFESTGRYSSNNTPNLDVFLKGKDGSFIRVDRGSRPPVMLDRPCLPIVISPQPAVLAKLSENPMFRFSGFIARILCVFPESRLGFRTLTPVPVSPDVATFYHHTIRGLLSIKPPNAGTPQEASYILQLSPAAYARWKMHQMDIEHKMRPGAKLASMQDWASKLPGQTARIAACLHCATHAMYAPQHEKIDEQTMLNAISLAEMFTSHAVAFFDLLGADADLDIARRAWAWVERNQMAEFTARDCWHEMRGSVKKMKDAEAAFGILMDTLHIEEVPKPATRAGRPSRIFRVNPRIVRKWEGK
jgi:hypothetical protein